MNKPEHTIIIRCDGSHSIGLGHVVRCLALAQKLNDHSGITVFFAVRFDELAIQMISEKGFEIITPHDNEDFHYEHWLLESLTSHNSKTLILDARDGLTFENILNIKKNGICVMSIDDIEDKRRACDAVFYPPIPQAKSFNWDAFTGTLYWGWEYVLLRDEFNHAGIRKQSNKPRLLISMGGTDPKNLTGRIVQLLAISKPDCYVDIAIGSGYKQKDELLELCKDNEHFTIFQNHPKLSEIMANADAAIISFGVTAYEIAALGVPALYICLFAEQMDSASTFVDNGCAINLGEYQTVTDQAIVTTIQTLIGTTEVRAKMQEKLSHLAIKNGAKNISDIIISNIINTI